MAQPMAQSPYSPGWTETASVGLVWELVGRRGLLQVLWASGLVFPIRRKAQQQGSVPSSVKWG